jgi:hypothetical protein
MSARSETEEEHERLVDGAKFGCVEASSGPAESLWVDDRCLFDKDACLLVLEGDRWAEAGRPGACRGGRNEDGAEVEELVGLDDNGVAGAALFVPAHVASSRQVEQLAADHVSC